MDLFEVFSLNPPDANGATMDFPEALSAELEDPAGYVPSAELLDAIKVALILRKPLLVTGEAGAGKTGLAGFIRHRMRLTSPLLKFECKSTSDGKDVFYTYNTLARFHAAQTGQGSRRSADYISYCAIGMAFLRSWSFDLVGDVLPSTEPRWTEGTRSVVLVDEIDKAPHDFPNDILNELELRYFRIPELGNARIQCNEQNPPFVVLTSNSEKTLSDPFLRRCVYFHIPKLTRKLAQDIALRRVAKLAGRADAVILEDALEFFFMLRGEMPSGKEGFSISEYTLERKPGAAELLDWLLALGGLRVQPSDSLRVKQAEFLASLGAVVKGEERDSLRATALARKWIEQTAQR
jgi:MoxR-like ATPase